MNITSTSHDLFLSYARRAGTWSATVLVGGKLTKLKQIKELNQADLISTFSDRGNVYLRFTPAGVAYALENGVNLCDGTAMQNYFPTLNAALAAEGLLDSWDCSSSPIARGETRRWTWQDGSRHGRQCSVYRDETGRYERPVHYAR